MNDYSFDRFLTTRDDLSDFDNPFLQKLFSDLLQEEWEVLGGEIERFADKVSFDWRALTKVIARPENHPILMQYDAYNRRVDEIIRPGESVRLTKEVFQEGVFSSHLQSYEGIIKRYFLNGNGEAGVTCPIACTDGLIALIEAFYEEVPEEVKEIHRSAKEGIEGHFAVGAQFMSEIQGGSNIPANQLKAVADGEHYRLYGNKFFCSAVHADYSVVTARVESTDTIAVFVVPSYLDGKQRNGYRINRLKWKLGTTELPSGEIDYDGALAYRIGPVDRGVALAVSIVLTRSRLDIGFSSAAFVMRAAREAKMYARFRHVFDRKIDEFPMALVQIEALEEAAKRMTATAFHIYQQFFEMDQLTELEQFSLRELILLQKIFVSKEAVDQLRLAISIFGGHGAIEDFSSIPRLFRDSMVNELWEGPRNVLLSQIYRDFGKLMKQIPLEEILRTMFCYLTKEELANYCERIHKVVEENLVDQPNDRNKFAAKSWEVIWEELFFTYQVEVSKKYKQTAILSEDVLKTL